jgi:periplasmic mercuric ion binding protein
MKKALFFLLMTVTLGTSAQADKGLAELSIKTNAVCDMCVKTIETELLYEKGVKAVKVDLAQNIIHVTADGKKTDVENVRKAIAKLGYAADEVLPNIPDCCKKEGCGLPVNPEEHK